MRDTPERNPEPGPAPVVCLLCPECGHNFVPDPQVYAVGPLRIGHGVGLTYRGEYVHLSPRELTMMVHLARSHPHWCSRENLLDACGLYDTDPHIISVMIYNLRRKLRGMVNISGRFLGWKHEGMHYGLELIQ